MRMKKIFSAVLALSVICGGIAPFVAEMPDISLTANAASENKTGTLGNDITWILDSEGTLTINGTGKMKNFSQTKSAFDDDVGNLKNNIKNVVISDGITNIGNYLFRNCQNIKTVTIPDSVQIIGSGAFARCLSLESITIPDSVMEIGDHAFSTCSKLESIDMPDKLTIIAERTFEACSNLKSINIPNSVTIISKNAFSNSGLESVTIPDSVTELEAGSFYLCHNLKSISFSDSISIIPVNTFGACYSIIDVTLPQNITGICSNAFANCNSLESISILNPNCEFFDSDRTISNVENYYSTSPAEYNGVIRGYDNSTAQAYAEKYNRKFESLGAAPTNTATESGDLNDDGKIDANDATLVLVNYSLLSTGEKMQLTESQQKAADVNGDGKIDSSDATTILQYYSYLSTGGKDSFADFMASQK